MLTSIVFAAFGHYVFGIAMTFTAVFLILLILVQRGKGGGLSGALGGMGGQSAFGTKAGDAFTKITIGASLLWILLCIGAVRFLGATPGAFETDNPTTQNTDNQIAPPTDGLDATLPDTSTTPDSTPSETPATDETTSGNDENSTE